MIEMMDIDQIIDVPDTPDRLVNKHGTDGRNGVKTENQLALLPCHELKLYPEKGSRDQPCHELKLYPEKGSRDQPCHELKLYPEKGSRDQPMIIDSGSKACFSHPPKCPSSPNSSRHPPTSSSYSLMSSSSSRKANLIRKVENKPCYPTHYPMQKNLEHVGTSHASKSSLQDDDFVDLTEMNPHRPPRGNASSSAVPGNKRADFQKRSILPPFSCEPSNLANVSRNGNAEMNNASRGGLSIAFGDMKKPNLSLDPSVLARTNKQKNLVRNGCISPNNIAKAKQPVGKAKQPVGKAKQPVGKAKQPVGKAKQPVGKAKHLAGKDINGSVAVAHNNSFMASNAPPHVPNIIIKELVAEENDSHARKGKGVISHTYSSSTKGPDWETKSSRSRSIKKAAETTSYNIGAGKSVEESSKWRSTRNPTREINNILSPDKEHHSLREGGSPKFSIQHQEKRLDRRGKGITIANGEDPSPISSEHFRAQSSKESASNRRARLGRLNEPHSVADTLIKRQKQGFDFSRFGECSTSVSDDLEVILLSSPAEAANSRSTSSNVNNKMPIIAETTIREGGSPKFSIQHEEKRLDRRGKGITIANGEDPSPISSEHFRAQSSKESASNPRVRLGRLNEPHSVADTLIKRQKQGFDFSRFGECSTSVSDDLEVILLSSPAEAANSRSTSSNVNNKMPIIEVDESSPQLRHDTRDEDVRAIQLEADELLARELQEQFYNEVPAFGVDEVDLQHRDGPNHDISRERQQQVLDSRLMLTLPGHSHPQSSPNAPRRGSLARSSTSGRMSRLRSHFPGQPRTVASSRGRTSIFPPGMDVDMRMHILGALEEFNDMGMSSGLLHANRDFNEDDYEMLLALDDGINHGGASSRQIDGLPQSTVQQSDYDEACAVCLDTPTVGDTIRHLPCLHKFHKDCIDPWLRRKTSCPVCKSSIT